MNAESAGLACSTASKVAEERDKMRDVMREIDAVVKDCDLWEFEKFQEIEAIIERWRA